MSSEYHLAELNIARALYENDDPRFKDFVDMIEPVNQMAERMPGYVWRLVDDSGVGTMDIKAFDDPRLLVNLSVWEDLDSLLTFVNKTVHARVMNRRKEWFAAMESHHLVLWWVPAGHQPDLAEARVRLEQLDRNGPSAEAFTIGKFYGPDGQEVAFDVTIDT